MRCLKLASKQRLAVGHELVKPLRRVMRYRAAVAKRSRFEAKVSEPRDACPLARGILRHHLRSAPNPAMTSAADRVAREQYAASPV